MYFYSQPLQYTSMYLWTKVVQYFNCLIWCLHIFIGLFLSFLSWSIYYVYFIIIFNRRLEEKYVSFICPSIQLLYCLLFEGQCTFPKRISWWAWWRSFRLSRGVTTSSPPRGKSSSTCIVVATELLRLNIIIILKWNITLSKSLLLPELR